MVQVPRTAPRTLEAGYYTYWVSNQEKQGSGIQPIPTLASTSDSTRFVRIRTAGDWNASPDSDILPLLFDRTKTPAGKDLFEVVHLMGSHTPYSDRYVHEKAPFTVDNLPKTLPNREAYSYRRQAPWHHLRLCELHPLQRPGRRADLPALQPDARHRHLPL